MSWKFIGGLLLGCILGVAVVVGGGYYFFFLKDASQGPAQVGYSEPGNDKVAALLKTTSTTPVLRFTLEVPAKLKAQMPSQPFYSVSLVQVGEGGRADIRGVTPKPDGSFEYALPPEFRPGDYRLSLLICRSKDSCAVLGGQTAEARAWFPLAAGDAKTVELGKLLVNRLFPEVQPCVSAKVLLAGKVVPTSDFIREAGDRHFVFTVVARPLAAGGPARMRKGGNLVDGQLADKLVYADPSGQVDSFVLHAVPFEPKKGPLAFSVPAEKSAVAELVPAVVACKGNEDAHTCARNAFPIPLNSFTAPGRYYRLVGEDYKVPRCGMQDLTLFAHPFGVPGVQAVTTSPDAPAEVRENSGF